MYRLFVEEHFDAAHYLSKYRGKCENLHGHRFTVIVRLETTDLDSGGLAYDFAELKKALREVLSHYDHTCLNDLPAFDKSEPSCENIAAGIYHALGPYVDTSRARLTSVEVWESPTTGVAYSV